MNVFVTGANGFLGKAVVERLAKKNKVTAFLLHGTSTNGLEGLRNVKIAYGDILEKDSILRALGKCKVVYHLAAAVRVPDFNKQQLYMLNVKGTENVLNACVEKKVNKVIYASTIAIYGKAKNHPKIIIDEDFPIYPVLNYAKTKLFGERLVKGICSKHKMNYIILRPSKLYGPGDKSLLPILKIVNKGLSFTIGKGNGITMPVYIDDAADAFVLALNSKKKNQEYIITGLEFITKRKFISIMAHSLGKKPRKIKIPVFPIMALAHIGQNLAILLKKNFPLVQKMQFFLASRRYSIEKARKHLKYNPQVGIQEMVSKTLNWYKEQGLI
ncbi:MAG: NAD(P)-dependent oxidoreductase [Nanoarchaeota archaeon]|nr:NAD(P)-dependent oxidoreductase [Nanoarchaeota archaeon]